MGPGTRIITNLVEGIMPTDYNDKVAMQHDVDYLLAEDFTDILNADSSFSKSVTGVEGSTASGLLNLKNTIRQIIFPNDNKIPVNFELTRDEVQSIADLLNLRVNDKFSGGAGNDW